LVELGIEPGKGENGSFLFVEEGLGKPEGFPKRSPD